jgi:hypothetical protein
MRRRLLFALGATVLGMFALHCFFVPAYDGPDEPFHLARVLAFSRGPFVAALQGAELPADLAASVSRRPCGPDLSRVFDCRRFPSKGSIFNLLSEAGGRSAGSAILERNYENQQPPLYYAVAGLMQRGLGIDEPDHALLFLRLLSVFFVAIALFGPLRVLSRDWPPALAWLFLLALLVPGAAEALARGSNDAFLFLWVAVVLAALRRERPWYVLALLLAAGPLIKLTAFPVVAFAVVRLWRSGRRRTAGAALAASLTVLPVQWARGWLLGATYTYETRSLGEGVGQVCVGLLRSAWGLVKSAFWVGGWTAFRPPWALVAAAVVVVALALVILRPIRLRPWPEHALAAAVAVAGTIVIAVGNRRFAGSWGGLCGWYLWGWSPWIAAYLSDTSLPTRVERTPLVVAAIAVILAANVVWFFYAVAAYG